MGSEVVAVLPFWRCKQRHYKEVAGELT